MIVRGVVLAYHAVSPTWVGALTVTPARLEAQVRLLLGRGLRPVTFGEAVLAGPSAPTLAVTFDDAYRSIDELAFPILRRLAVPATVFAPTAYVGIDGPMAWPGLDVLASAGHGDELAPMSWDELGALAEHGWEVGSHTRSHPRLTRLGDAELAEELEASRAELERRLGRPCRSLAYPYGDVDERVAVAAAAAGYRAAADARPWRRPQPLRWPRIGVYSKDVAWRFRLKVSPVMRRALAATEPWRR